MAQLAGVWAIFLTEALGQIRARDVDLMGARLKEKRVDDARHMARDAAAGFRAGGVMCMRGDTIPKLVVTAETHLVGIVPEFHRREVILGVSLMG